MISFIKLICTRHSSPLQQINSELICEKGCVYPVVDQIPRFVPAENYSSSFGLQWNTFRSTQLDSFTGLTISRDRLTRIAGGSLDIFRAKTVLEAGCGAGRFTELMLEAGALLFAVDLSSAVDANYENCAGYSNYFVVQADLRELPVLPEQFDVVVCIGVIQHTPDPEATMQVLSSHVKPGGILLIDHYTYGYPMSFTRKILRSYLLKKPQEYRILFVKQLTAWLWPFHRLTYRLCRLPLMKYLRFLWLYFSPVVDYQDAYPSLNQELVYEWAVLDTHDLLTDYYKHLRSAEDIASLLASFGMTEVMTRYAGNGVEASARKPAKG